MDTIKVIGTREEVYKSQAHKTIGGLTKIDILEKCNNGKINYISKKLSDKMRLQINTIRENNPNFFKNKKRTHCVSSIISNHTNHSEHNHSEHNHSAHNKNIYNKKKKSKTHKLSFEINNNKVKTIYYPELNGLNIEELKEEIRRQEEEENEEDDVENIEEFESLNELKEVFTKPQKQSVNTIKNKNFVIEELSDEVNDFNIHNL